MPRRLLLLIFAIPILVAGLSHDVGRAYQLQQETSAARPGSPLSPCRIAGINEEVLCGTFEVYENRATKTGRKIPLNIIVLPALSKPAAPDPLFVLYGGPGQAATSGAAGDARRFAEIRRERDIVLVDQRGTGRSNGLNCDLGGLSGVISSFVTGEFPIDRIRQCREELEKRADLRFYTTPIAMDDLDEVRSRLGYEKINLYGGSYGTRAALVYLKRHPERVRTVTLRGVFSLDPLYFARDGQRALDLLFDDCARDPDCAGAYPNLRRDFQALIERLEKTPASLVRIDARTGRNMEFVITREAFTGAIRRMLYDTETQRRIPLMIKKAMDGNYQPFEEAIAQVQGIMNSFSVGMFLSVACVEKPDRYSPEQIARETTGSFLGDHQIKSALSACDEWPRGALPKDYFDSVKGDAPALILSGNIDPVTPPVWGEKAAKTLPESLHLTMEGIAHGPFPACALDVMARFIASGSTKGLDTNCIKSLRRPPFVRPPTVQPLSFESIDPVEHQLARLEQEWIEMSARGDRMKLNSFLPDDFAQMGLIDAEEDRASKAQWIDNVLRITTQVDGGTFNLDKLKVSVYGDTATTHARWMLKGILNGRSITNTIAVMDIWRKREGKWQAVTRYVASVPAAK